MKMNANGHEQSRGRIPSKVLGASRIHRLFHAACVLALFALSSARAEGEAPLPVYRFYSPAFKGHFFTISEAEKNKLVTSDPNWRYESIAYRAFTNQVEGTTPLYRFYSRVFKGHFFTTSEAEMRKVRNTDRNWTYEGIAYYVYPRATEGTAPVYRFWSRVFHHHFYTMNAWERDKLIATDPNWTYESIAFFAPPLELVADQYCVVDLSGGPEAGSYPVSYRPLPPAEGWTGEYKTTKLVLRRIEPGSFTMGSPVGEVGHFADERQHASALTSPYYLAVFECTQRQWELVMGFNPARYAGGTRPVEMVSFEDVRGSAAGAGWPASGDVDAASFMGRLRAKTGLNFDLPTEAQWELACRARMTTALNMGTNLSSPEADSVLSKLGRYASNRGDRKGGYGEHTSVGSYFQNPWGLHDMHGNVGEWCLDWYGTFGSEAVTNAAGATAGTDRVLRGGGWNAPAQNCRSACRDHSAPGNAHYNIGFRPAIVLP